MSEESRYNNNTSYLIPTSVYFSQQHQDNNTSDASTTDNERLQQAKEAWQRVFAAKNANVEGNNIVNREIILTTENLRTNNYWGDELIDKGEQTLRIYGANVNGFTLDRRGGQYDNFCRTLKEVQADIGCGQEHNLDTTKSAVRSILHNTTRQHWKRNRVDFATTPVPFENQYKPGGTFIVAVGSITSRMIERSQDKWGRWVSQTYQGRGGRLFTVISAYQVVTDKPNPGTSTAAAQQLSLLLRQQDEVKSPRVAFRRDIKKFIVQCQASGHDILMAGDFNEKIGSDPDSMAKLMHDCGLVDIMRRQHHSKLPNTYARGQRCLDYVIATEHVANAVKKAGYEPFNARFPSDHRAYFVDLSISELFDIQMRPLAKHSPRNLQSTNVSQVTAYIEKKHEYLSNHNVFERIKHLKKPGHRHKFAEKLDKDITEASLAAEKTIARFGEAMWSVTLAKARKKAQTIEKCMSMLRTRIANEDKIRQDWEEVGAAEPVPLTSLSECTALLKLTKKEIRSIVEDSYQQRAQEQKNRIEVLEKSVNRSDQEQATRLRKLQKAEAINRLFEKLRSLQQTKNRTGVTRIEIPSPRDADPLTCDTWIQVDLPDEVAYHLRERNRKHFGQAAGTPFTVPPLNEDLRFNGQGEAAEDILTGEYQYKGHNPNVHLLLKHIHMTAQVHRHPMQPTITEKEFTGKLKTWRETTTTSPSGLHLGHYKALICRHAYSATPEEEDDEHREKRERWNRMQQDLLEVHMTLLNYGLSRGYAFQRWKTVANTILFKDPGVIKIHRTRVIHLYEADYNLAMGLKWRKALHQAEILKSLHNGQFGSRPHRNAIDPVFIEEMQFELSRLTRKTFAQTNYDATACYDRIIPSLAVLASRSFGVPKESTAVNAKTLEGASYHIRTELGVTPEGYSHSVEAPIFGTGQGSGNSPAIWCFLSSLLYQCYDTGAHPARYCYPDHTNHLNIGMIGFVDDSNGQTNTFLENVGMISTSGIHASVQKNAQHWANLLSASGGALELSKCSVHVAQWGFTLHGAPVLCTDKADFDNITVVDPVTRQERHLKYLSPYSAHKTLGHHKEPAGTQRKQLSELRTKSDNVTSFLTTCSLTREEGWTYYYACYLPGISYPLANSHFTERELATVQRKAMTRIIPKCGYNRNMKKEILFGPLKYGGANFRHLYDQQGLGQITLFLSHWRQNTETGKLLKTAVAWAQYATGMGTPIFDHTTRHIPHLESKWIASLRVYLGKSQVSLTFEPLGIPQLERAHDGYLMEWIIQSNWFTEKEIVSLNYCRLFLNVVTLSDMTNAIGDAIDPGKLEGNPSLKSSTSTWMFINQAKPSSQAWKLWKNANLIWSKSTGQLHQPLGHWISTLTNRRIRHFAYKYRSTLYIRMHQTRYMKCRQIKRDTYTETDLCIDIQSIPERAKPAEVELLPDSIWHVLATSAVTVTPNNPQHDIGTFERFLSNLDAWEYDLLRHTTLFADPFAVNVAHEDYFAAGSDGSVKHGTNGSFGWMLSTREGVRTASGMGPSRGLRMDSYRAECSGLLSLLRFLVRVGEYTQRAEPWSGIVVTDSESMLKTLFGEDNVRERRPLEVHDLRALDVMIAEWDLLNEIQMSLRQLPEVVLQYVKGHQDRNRTYASLPLFAQLNVDADDKAGEYQQEFGRPHPFVLLSPHAGVNIHFPEGTLTANVVSEIRRRTTGLPLKKYIQQRNKWHDSTMEAINWAAHAKALESQINQRVHLTKLVHECLPTFSRNNRFKLGAARKCPGCQQADETRDHILRCPNDKYRNWRALFYEGIKKFHETADTSPLLRNLWNEAMEVWFATEIEDIQVSPVLFPNELRRVIIQQNAIGWRQVFNGRFSNEWAQVQNEYTARRTTANSTCKSVGLNGLQWQQKFILEIWKSWRKVWTLRNEMVHGKDLAAQKVAQRQAITAELHAIYQHRNHIEPHVQTLLLPDVQEHLQRPPGATRNWLNTNVPVLRESLRRAKRNAVKGVRSIKSYFAPLR